MQITITKQNNQDENKENPETNKIIFPFTKPLSQSEEMISILDNTIDII